MLPYLSISIPVQNSFNSLLSDFSQQMENLVNGVSSTKENMTELERKVNSYLQSQKYNWIRLRLKKKRFCLWQSVTDYIDFNVFIF